LQLRFLEDTTQLDKLVSRLRSALLNSTGGTGKSADINFSNQQAELDGISRENTLQFSTPPFFTVIIHSLTILEGVALLVDPCFRPVRRSYPFVLRQLLVPEADDRIPAALQRLLIRLLALNGEGKEIEWERLRDLLRLSQKARSTYNPAQEETDKEDSVSLSRQTIELFFKFLTSKTGLFLKLPLVHKLAEATDGMASVGEANLLQAANGLLPPLPGMSWPINHRVMNEMSMMLDTFRNAMAIENNESGFRLLAYRQVLDEITAILRDERLREDAGPLLEEVRSDIQMAAVEELEIQGSRAMRSILRVAPPPRLA
jgi:hypothetical protein